MWRSAPFGWFLSAVYLTVAGVPCISQVPPSHVAGVHANVAAPSGLDARPGERAAPSGHATHDSHSGHATEDSHPGHATHAASESASHSGPTPEAAVATEHLAPVCPCGCGDGGVPGAASGRIGPALLAWVDPWLDTAAETPDATDPQDPVDAALAPPDPVPLLA